MYMAIAMRGFNMRREGFMSVGEGRNYRDGWLQLLYCKKHEEPICTGAWRNTYIRNYAVSIGFLIADFQ